MADWDLLSREPPPYFRLSGGLPIVSAEANVRHLGVASAVVTTPYSEDAWGRLAPSCGIALWRNGRSQFGGPITERRLTWDAESGRALIKAMAVGDEVVLADRLVFPDPLRAADDQTVNDYWMPRDAAGVAVNVAASTAMLQLISDQAGPTCRPDRRVTGLTVGEDQAVGTIRKYWALFTDVMSTLASISVVSQSNLGVRVAPSDGGLRATLYDPRDLSEGVRFSADLSNLVGFEYAEQAPTLTNAVAAGQGDLHTRLRRTAATADATALTWARQIWSYIDRRDTADAADLVQEATDAVAGGGPMFSLALTLADSQAATYGVDWGLGDRVTVYVGLPGQVKAQVLVDVVREIYLAVDSDGAETIRPAVGTDNAKAFLPGPNQKTLAKIGARLAALETRK